MPSNPLNFEQITLRVKGNEHTNWTSYEVDSDLLKPADTWNVSLRTPAQGLMQVEYADFGKVVPTSVLPDYLKPWAEVSLSLGDTQVLAGRIDSITRATAKDKRTLEISGRNLAGALLDCSAVVFTKREVTLKEAVDQIVKPLGISNVHVLIDMNPFEKISVEPGMRAWDLFMRACDLNGCHAWFAPDGTLIIGGPDYEQEPVAELVLDLPDYANSWGITTTDRTGSNTNLISLTIKDDLKDSHSEIRVLGQTHGIEKEAGKHNIDGKALDAALQQAGVNRPLIVRDDDADTAQAQAKAKKKLSEGQLTARTITIEVHGHRVVPGKPSSAVWTPGQRVRVVSTPDGVDDVFFLTGRTLKCGPGGVTTTLRLNTDKVWMA